MSEQKRIEVERLIEIWLNGPGKMALTERPSIRALAEHICKLFDEAR